MVRNKVLLLLFFLFATAIIVSWQSELVNDFSNEQKWTLVLLALAIYLWTAAPMPTGASSILLLACILAFQLVERPEEAFVGFLSPALYFILMLSIVSQALVKSGVDKVFVQILLKFSKGGAKGVLIGLPLLILYYAYYSTFSSCAF